MSREQEAHLTYNHLDDKYYIYEGETFVADTDSLPMALQYFLALIEGDVTHIGDNKLLYGPTIQYDKDKTCFNCGRYKELIPSTVNPIRFYCLYHAKEFNQDLPCEHYFEKQEVR